MKLLIADDEPIVREGLKQLLDWVSLGFSICSEARNGEETLNKVLNMEPDLVLLDIKMPKLTGVEIIQRAREQGFKGHFIILSGYSDFSYAQTAIRYDVDYYLTKPVNEDKLEEAVTKVYNLVRNEREKTTALHQYREKARDTILRHLLTGAEDISSLNLTDLNLMSDMYQVVIYERYSQDSFPLSLNFAELLRVGNQDHSTFDHITIDEREIILLKGNFALERFQNLLNCYDKNQQKGVHLDTLFLTYGKTVYQLNQIQNSYEDALRLLHRRFFSLKNQHIFGYQELIDASRLKPTITEKELQYYPKIFFDYISTFNRPLLEETLRTLEWSLFFATEPINTIKHFLIDIYLQVKHNISHNYSFADIPYPTNAAVIDFIEKKYYLYEIIQFLSKQFEMYMKAIRNPSSENILDDILHYINHNYQENLKLEAIAHLFGYNSSYLGKIFTKRVGESFHSYLDRIRIEKSKELLLSNLWKVYEISEKVGYNNVDYFHKKFKKYTGISPAEYRKRCTKEPLSDVLS